LFVVLVEHLVVEPVYLVDLLRLVVASHEVELIGVEELVAEQRKHDLYGPGASVHKVAVEQVTVAVTRSTEQLQDPEEQREDCDKAIID
jgi:hypothetical protein